MTAGIPAVMAESTGSGVTYYIREPNGSLIARCDSINGMRYYHFDQLGSTRVLTDSTGAATDRYDYDAYGAVLWHERHAASIDQPYQYVGQLGYYTCWQEPDFGLLQLGVRFYDAHLGRFTQRDPIRYRQGSNLYAYTKDRPADRVDASGKIWAMPGANGEPVYINDPTPPLPPMRSDISIRNPGETYEHCLDRCVGDLNPWWTVPGGVGVACGVAAVPNLNPWLGVAIGGSWAAGTSAECFALCIGVDPEGGHYSYY